jgi:xylulokinase
LSELLLGIDIGTASSKGVLAEPDGTVVAVASRDHRVSMPESGHVEHDAESVWWADVVSLCAELLAHPTGGIAAVGVSGIGPCVVPCTENDVPLRPAILYGVDTRAGLEVAELTELLGEQEILRRCGSVLSSQALGPKLAWLRRHEPNVYARTERWHMASSFVTARLTGDWALDHHSASQCDPLYELDACDWNRDWADVVAPGLPLPRLCWPSDVVGTVRAAAAAETGIPAGTPVIAGTIDAWAEAVSAGVRRTGELMMQYGSTLFLILGTDHAAGDPSIWTTCGVDPGSRTLAAGLATAGALTEWVRELTGRSDYHLLVRAAEQLPPGSDGLLLLPYFAGERTPILDPDARGTIVGLTTRHDAGALYRAALEGIAFGVRHNLEAMGAPAGRVAAVGGGTNADVWLQIVSDVTGLAQEVPDVAVGASYGDALLAAEGAGLVEKRSSWSTTRRTVEPDVSRRGIYDELYGLYRSLYPATRDVQHALARLQRDSTRRRT